MQSKGLECQNRESGFDFVMRSYRRLCRNELDFGFLYKQKMQGDYKNKKAGFNLELLYELQG